MSHSDTTPQHFGRKSFCTTVYVKPRRMDRGPEVT